MCAALELNETRLRPGQLVAVWTARGALRVVWAGFARRESLRWWKQQGGELVDIPAHRFAERSDRDRQLRWDQLPPGHVIRGLLAPAAARDGDPLLKVVTRPSTPEELARYEHDRMPVLEIPLRSAEIIPVPAPGRPAQAELFG